MTLENWPLEHVEQDDAETPEYLPAEHSVHTVLEAAAYVPARQVTQLLNVLFAYFPDGQVVSHEVAEEDENLPDEQSMHDAALVLDPYWPALQSVQLALPASENVPVPHVEQLVSPPPVEYFPSEHFVQVVLAELLEYFPG